MTLCFRLTMPGCASWNGKWSGDGVPYLKVVSLGSSKSARQTAERIAKRGHYVYAFGDGWLARVLVTVVDSREAKRIRSISRGFCGYDWMIDAIIATGEITWAQPGDKTCESE